MKHIDLTRQDWQLLGWRPFSWQIGKSMELGMSVPNDIPAMPANVPGSVQAALHTAGWLKDWNVGMNSLTAEWVENRHWEFVTRIEAGAILPGEPVILCADGLDYSGWVLVDDQIAATFKGALKRHRIDLSAFLSDGKAHQLGILFDAVPDEQGQVGFTVQSRYFKPRYNYGWDFCPRMVPIGIWDVIGLEVGWRKAEVLRVSTELGDDLETGRVTALVRSEECDIECELRISQGAHYLRKRSFRLRKGENHLEMEVSKVRPWWPNGWGDQPLYGVSVSIVGQPTEELRVGFKKVRWLPCDESPNEALSWICEVNGEPIFLQGVNWTPLQLDYHSTPVEKYRHRIGLYRAMGCNVLRVWGGGFLEKKIFYDLCDEAGLLVWQEFPLSSSGIDNWPPEDPEVIRELGAIARDYIRRRRHHVSKLLWCGGNELQHAPGSKTGVGIPIDLSHPCIAELERIVAEEDPGVRFLPASSSGPQFCAASENFGKGMHHDVHGPWNTDNLKNWEAYWSEDDALLRSETGMPGAASLELIERYCGDAHPWPPDRKNPYYLHGCAWWIQWDYFCEALHGLKGHVGLKKYVELSQELQAQALTMAVKACRDRFPKCGGVILWMGHDLFPCPINTSVIDFEGNPKMAYHAVRKIFQEALPSRTARLAETTPDGQVVLC